ncbi:MAG: Trk system potassium transporter TrkA [Planctomycetes bacterium]|nr:Trk system potassium transporter TrkA [Planctomycetota bacterium]
MMASEMGSAKKTLLARIHNEEYSELAQRNPDHPVAQYINRLLNPDHMIVESISKRMELPSAIYTAQFADGAIVLAGFNVTADAPIAGKKLAELKETFETDTALIGGIYRDGQLIIAHGGDEIKPGDDIYAFIAKDTVPFFLPLLNRRVWELKKAIIYGANTIGLALAQKLEDKVEQVVLIEEDNDKAEAAAARLNTTIILKGKATSMDILTEAGAENADFFIALSDSDEDNLASCLLAKKKGTKRTIVLTNEPDYVPILDAIDGTDIVINPYLITTSAILEYIRRGKIRTVVKLKESGAEVIELEAQTNSPIIKKTLSEINLPREAIIGVVLKNNTPIIPRGDTIVKPGERVIVFTLPEAVKKIEKLFNPAL